MKNITKDTFNYQNESFINSETVREKIKKIEKEKIDLSLKQDKEYMTLYATSKGIIILKHADLEEAITTLNVNKIYYRQIWVFIKQKGAYNYVSEYPKGKEIIY